MSANPLLRPNVGKSPSAVGPRPQRLGAGPVSAVETPARVENAPDTGEVELSIVMPCLNEAETLEVCIRKAQGFLRRSGVSGEVVVGDNGSTDGSVEIARRCGARVVPVPLRGYGAALHAATLAARGRYVIMGDSDDSYDFTALAPFLEKLRDGHDVVMGNRFAGGIRPGAMPWKNRYIGNPVLTGIGRLFFGCPARDFHCGLRGYSKDAYRRLDMRTTGMEFASEMVIKATLQGLSIAEVPTTLSPDGRSRPPHLRPWRDGWRHLVFMLLFSPKWLFVLPGLLLAALGAAGMAWLWPGARGVGAVTFDVHTMFFAAMFVLIGFQTLIFGAFTRIYATQQGLMPPDARIERLFRWVTLETGLIAGALVLSAGLCGTAAAVLDWGRHGFGPLDPTRTLRLVIPSGLALTLGIQIIFSSFFLRILGMAVRRLDACGESPSR
ncbi:MAG: glycosyltransferase family 2 protein [Isosphaeraceae bacterium]